MLVNFIVGVNTFSFEPIIITVFMDSLDNVKGFLFCPNAVGETSAYKAVLGYPTGFV